MFPPNTPPPFDPFGMPPPAQPQAPSPAMAPPVNVAQDPRQQLLTIATIGAMLGAGPRSGIGAGLGHGDIQGVHDLQQLTDAHQVMAFRQQQELADQQRQQQHEADQRQQQLQNAVMTISQRVQGIPDKNTYDVEIGGYAKALQGAGYRLDENWLRQAVPFVAPSAEKTAARALEAFQKNPANAALMKDHPEQLANAMIQFDVDGDGVPESVPLMRVAAIAKMPFATDASGKLLTYPKGTTLDAKANADGFYQDLLKQAEAEGKDITDPKVTMPLRTQALELAATEKGTPTDGNYMLNGKPIVAVRTRGKLTYQGQDVTDQVTPYVPPVREAGGESGGLTPDGLEYAATQYRVTGTMPSIGQRSNQARTSIVNAAAAQAKLLGQTPAAAIQRQAAYKGDTAALQQVKKMSAAAESFESKALQQADLVSQLSPTVDRTKWPIINNAILAGKTEIAGDQQATLLVNAVTTFATEYAKIMEGSTGSSGGSSDAARRASSRLISASMNPRTLQATLDQMKREMRFTIQGYAATEEHITTKMGGVVPDVPTSTPPAANPGRFTIVPKGGQ